MSPVKPRRLTWDEIRARAEDFREMYVHPADKIPVPIEEIVEFELNITPWPIPGLLKIEKIREIGFQVQKYLFLDLMLKIPKKINLTF